MIYHCTQKKAVNGKELGLNGRQTASGANLRVVGGVLIDDLLERPVGAEVPRGQGFPTWGTRWPSSTHGRRLS